MSTTNPSTRLGVHRVLHVASEAAPWAVTGGLGEVVGSLPHRQRGHGDDVRVMLPAYRGVLGGSLARGASHGLTLQLGGRALDVEIIEAVDTAGTPYLLVRRDDLYDRGGLYAKLGRDYGDNGLRFGVLGLASVEAIRAGIVSCDVLHLHDWQAAMAAVFLAARRQDHAELASIRTLLTVLRRPSSAQ